MISTVPTGIPLPDVVQMAKESKDALSLLVVPHLYNNSTILLLYF